MKKFACIVAGGTGTRMLSEIPKQFLTLHEKPVLLHTLLRFKEADPGIAMAVVLPSTHIGYWENLCNVHDVPEHKIINGGSTRYDSVKNGLDAFEENGLVAVHDAVRPLITPAFINRLFEKASENGNAVPVIHIQETIRMVEGSGNRSADRSLFRIVQTPQVFDLVRLKKAFSQPYRQAFTDEATVMELAGETIHLVDGEAANIKITTPADLSFAERMMV